MPKKIFYATNLIRPRQLVIYRYILNIFQLKFANSWQHFNKAIFAKKIQHLLAHFKVSSFPEYYNEANR